VAIGRQALLSNTTASNNTAVGFQAGYSNTTGSVTAFGSRAGASFTTAIYVTAIGGYALENATGSSNTAVGFYAGQATTTGVENAMFGTGAMQSNTTGSYNAAIGRSALFDNTTGSFNTAVGYDAAQNITTGNDNTCLGYRSGTSITTGVGNIMLGYNANPASAGNNYEMVCGVNATGKGGNTGFFSMGSMYQGNNSANWATISDQRLKKNIVDNNDGLNKITAITVRNFEYRLPEEITDFEEHCAINKSGVQLGVIAQELQQVLPECVKEQTTGVLSLDTENLTWYLINAVKQLKAEVDSLKQQINQQ
jgi:hypothetical protein